MKKQTTTPQPPETEKTLTLIKKHNAQIYYENTDFLTVRLTIDSTTGYPTAPISKHLFWLVENSDTCLLDFGFKIKYYGVVCGSRVKAFHILDTHGTEIAQIHVVLPSKKKDKTYYTDIEFKGTFFTAYFEYFDYFCFLCWIDRKQQNITSRFDYCIDISGLKLDDILLFTKERKRQKNQRIEYGTEATYTNKKGARHHLCLYDKKLDILEKGKHKLQDNADKYIYKHYIQHKSPILRIEYRKNARALNELADNSIDFLFSYGRQLMVDYFHKFYTFDLTEFLKYAENPLLRQAKPKRKDNLLENIKTRKYHHNFAMCIAYANNCIDMRNKKRFIADLDKMLDFGGMPIPSAHYAQKIFDRTDEFNFH